MKYFLITVVMMLFFSGCAECESNHGMYRLTDTVDGINREVQVILEQILMGSRQDYEAVLEAMHPDLRLFNRPISESNRSRLMEFRESLEAQRGELEFAVTRRYFIQGCEVVEVIVADGKGVPRIWYFMRSEEGGKLLLRETPILEVGVQFRIFMLSLPEEVVEKAEFSNAMAVERERRMAVEGKP